MFQELEMKRVLDLRDELDELSLGETVPDGTLHVEDLFLDETGDILAIALEEVVHVTLVGRRVGGLEGGEKEGKIVTFEEASEESPVPVDLGENKSKIHT